MHQVLIAIWQLGRIPQVRAAVAVIGLLLTVTALMNGDSGPLGRRLAAEMLATAAATVNASLAPPVYFATNFYLWLGS